MDSKEKRKQYYLNNKDKLLTYSKQNYYDNRNARLQYYYDNLDVRNNIIMNIGLYMVINT